MPSVWDVIRSQCYLNHELSQPQVQDQLRWLAAHPGYFQNLVRSEPYIYHIISEIKKRNMPGELALLPMIESAFNPFAYSGVGAAGIWQLMPGTGDNLGLKQDWWFDARRSIQPSTNAALNYLAHLNKFFAGNWILAIAAYDAGEGTVSRAIKNSGQSRRVNFWTLPVPRETKDYVPRLLALAEVIKNPERYGIKLPYIPYAPYFEEVNIHSQIDLSHAAQLAGMSYIDLIKLNPGYNRWVSAPNQPFKLLIPRSKLSDFNRNLSKVPRSSRITWNRHRVKPGDSLANIARQNFTTPKLLKELNQLKSDTLVNGQSLLLPSIKNAPRMAMKPIPKNAREVSPVSRTYKVVHIVQRGENLKSIALKYQVTIDKILLWNGFSASHVVAPGNQLILWRTTSVQGKRIASVK